MFDKSLTHQPIYLFINWTKGHWKYQIKEHVCKSKKDNMI